MKPDDTNPYPAIFERTTRALQALAAPDEFSAGMDEIAAYAHSLLPESDPGRELRDLLVLLVDSPQSFFTIHLERPVAGGTDQVVPRLEANERFRELVLAVRALKNDGRVVGKNCHG